MRDEDNRDAPLLQTAQQREEVILLFRGEALAVGSSKMMIRASKRTARAISTICFWRLRSEETSAVAVHIEVQRLEELLGRNVGAAQPVEEFLFPQIEVLRYREGRDQLVS